MPLSVLLAEPLTATSLNAAEAFLADLREPRSAIGRATTAEVAEVVGRSVGIEPGRVGITPGSVTLMSVAADGDLAPAMVNIDPTDPLRTAAPAGRRLYLVRHGEADTPDAEGRLHSHVPLPLTGRGRAQAAALGRAFAPVGADTVHASDIARTAETAGALAGERRVRLHAGLRELSLGSLEGAHQDEILAVAPGFLLDPDARLPEGESIREVGARAGAAVDRILAAQPAGEVVVVAHGGVNRSLFGHLLDLPLDRAVRVRQDWAGVNVFDWNGSAWEIVVLNWTPEGLAELDQAHRTRHLLSAGRPAVPPRSAPAA
jgi:broad specificity phosphatase PhoE